MAFPDKPIAHLLGSNGPVHALAYSASPGTYILTGSADRSIRLYNPQPSSSVSSSSFSSSSIYPGNNISRKSPSSPSSSSSSAAPAIPEGRLIQTYSAHGYEVLSLSVSASNERFASAGGDRLVFLWDVRTAQTIRRFGGSGSSSGSGGHTARVNCVAFAGAPYDEAGSESLLVSGSLDASVRIWDLRAGGGSAAHRPVQTLSEARDSVTSVWCGAGVGSGGGGGGGRAEVVAGSVDGRVRAYDVRAGRCVTDVVGPSVTSLCAARDGRALLVGGLDSRVRLLDRETGACLRAYGHPEFRNESLRVQSILGGKDQYVLVGDEMTAGQGQGRNGNGGGGSGGGSGEGRLWAWDVLTGDVKARLRVPWGPAGFEPRKKIVGKDGKEKERTNVISCMAWRDGGYGDQFCVSGTSGVVTVFGYH